MVNPRPKNFIFGVVREFRTSPFKNMFVRFPQKNNKKTARPLWLELFLPTNIWLLDWQFKGCSMSKYRFQSNMKRHATCNPKLCKMICRCTWTSPGLCGSSKLHISRGSRGGKESRTFSRPCQVYICIAGMANACDLQVDLQNLLSLSELLQLNRNLDACKYRYSDDPNISQLTAVLSVNSTEKNTIFRQPSDLRPVVETGRHGCVPAAACVACGSWAAEAVGGWDPWG